MKKKARIRILDEVNAVVAGLQSDHIEIFFKRFGVKAPNYYFHPKYRLGQWDGYIRYFSKAGKTYTYLLDEIIPPLTSFGYEFILEDKRQEGSINVDLVDENYFSHINDFETGEPIKLRYYQVEAANKLLECGYGVCVAGTGAGKTLLNAVLVDAYGQKGLSSITIVPTSDLIGQTKEQFLDLNMDVGEYSGDNKDIKHLHVVSTWQALQNNPSILRNFQVVIVDECHSLGGKILLDLLVKHGGHLQYRFGLTGTMPKEEANIMAVHIAVGPVRYEIPAYQLIEEKYLAKMDIDIYQLKEDFHGEYKSYLETTNDNPPLSYTKFKNEYFAEYTDEKRFLQTDKERLQWMVDYIELKRDEGRGNVLCLVNGIAFGRKLESEIEGAIFIYGEDSRKVRKEVYDLFNNNNNLVVIATAKIARLGLNIKRIFNLMFIDVGKSFITVIQSIGRGLRRAPDKEYVKVSDICSDMKYAKRHLQERIKYYREAKYPYKKHSINYRDI